MKGSDPEQASGARYYFTSTQFVEVLPPGGRTSLSRLDHVAFATTDAEGLRRYLILKRVDVLSAVRHGSDGSGWFDMTDTRTDWVSQQVPNGTDWLEYMLVAPIHGHGIRPGMKQRDVGVLDHFSLAVRNMEAAYTLLWKGGRLAGQDSLPKIGRDGKWQLNLVDPDGTRAEIMELRAVGRPCCSPFTASDPGY